VLELGCGLGLVGIAAALAGGRVLATDWSEQALEATRDNAARNGVHIDTARVDWAEPEPVTAQAPWPVVLGSDVLYERRNVSQMLDLLPRLVDHRGEVWIADPGRSTHEDFVAKADESWTRRTTTHGRIAIHRLRLRQSSAVPDQG
jgi:predicted nicotinamide N-methyase